MPLPNSFHKNPHKSARYNPKKSSLNFLTFSLIIITARLSGSHTFVSDNQTS